MTAVISVAGAAITAGWILLALLLLYWLLGLVLIDERQVGVVVKRFASRSLQPGSSRS